MESKAVVVSTYRFPRYTVFFVDLNLDREHAVDSSLMVAASCSLTCVPPKPRKPPSLAASETFWATETSHWLNPWESGLAFFSMSAVTCRKLSHAVMPTDHFFTLSSTFK